MSIQIIVLMNNNDYSFDENLTAGCLKTFLSSNNINVKLDYFNTDSSDNYENLFDVNAKIYAFALTEKNINSVYFAINVLKSINNISTVCVFDNFADYNYLNILKDNSNIDFIPFGNPNRAILQVYNNICNDKPWRNENIANVLLPNSNSLNKHYENNRNSCFIKPDRENLKKRNIIFANIISAYGCPAHCSFCTMPQIDGSLALREMSEVLMKYFKFIMKIIYVFFIFMMQHLNVVENSVKKELCIYVIYLLNTRSSLGFDAM